MDFRKRKAESEVFTATKSGELIEEISDEESSDEEDCFEGYWSESDEDDFEDVTKNKKAATIKPKVPMQSLKVMEERGLNSEKSNLIFSEFQQRFKIKQLPCTELVKLPCGTIEFSLTASIPLLALERITNKSVMTVKNSRPAFYVDSFTNSSDPTMKDRYSNFTSYDCDRGHTICIANHRNDFEALASTGNIKLVIPQNTSNNRNAWAVIERVPRLIVSNNNQLFVFTGVIPKIDLFGNLIMLANNEMAAVSKIFKISLLPIDDFGVYECISFMLPNESIPISQIKNYVCTIKQIEKEFGRDLFDSETKKQFIEILSGSEHAKLLLSEAIERHFQKFKITESNGIVDYCLATKSGKLFEFNEATSILACKLCRSAEQSIISIDPNCNERLLLAKEHLIDWHPRYAFLTQSDYHKRFCIDTSNEKAVIVNCLGNHEGECNWKEKRNCLTHQNAQVLMRKHLVELEGIKAKAAGHKIFQTKGRFVEHFCIDITDPNSTLIKCLGKHPGKCNWLEERNCGGYPHAKSIMRKYLAELKGVTAKTTGQKIFQTKGMFVEDYCIDITDPGSILVKCLGKHPGKCDWTEEIDCRAYKNAGRRMKKHLDKIVRSKIASSGQKNFQTKGIFAEDFCIDITNPDSVLVKCLQKHTGECNWVDEINCGTYGNAERKMEKHLSELKAIETKASGQRVFQTRGQYIEDYCIDITDPNAILVKCLGKHAGTCDWTEERDCKTISNAQKAMKLHKLEQETAAAKASGKKTFLETGQFVEDFCIDITNPNAVRIVCLGKHESDCDWNETRDCGSLRNIARYMTDHLLRLKGIEANATGQRVFQTNGKWPKYFDIDVSNPDSVLIKCKGLHKGECTWNEYRNCGTRKNIGREMKKHPEAVDLFEENEEVSK